MLLTLVYSYEILRYRLQSVVNRTYLYKWLVDRLGYLFKIEYIYCLLCFNFVGMFFQQCIIYVLYNQLYYTNEYTRVWLIHVSLSYDSMLIGLHDI